MIWPEPPPVPPEGAGGSLMFEYEFEYVCVVCVCVCVCVRARLCLKRGATKHTLTGEVARSCMFSGLHCIGLSPPQFLFLLSALHVHEGA